VLQEQMAMTEKRNGIDHSPIQLPFIFWTSDSVFREKNENFPWKLWKFDVRRMNKYCKIMRIIDASGKRFIIDRLEEVPAKSAIGAFFREKYWQTWVVPMISSEKQLSVEEFKKEVERAVRARGKYDLDSNIVAKTMEKLPHAMTYLEAIESLPKLI
jgi:hypothetical protein